MLRSKWSRSILFRRQVIAIAILCLLVAGYSMLAAGTDRDALWRIVSTKCVPNQLKNGDPSPCVEVDTESGFAILKDIRGNSQYLLIPALKITGIEDPNVLNPDLPDYVAAAWEARRYVEQRLGRKLSRSDVGLAINSPQGRSQDQLHIHIDCLQPSVRDTLRAHLSEIGEDWSILSIPLEGQTYHVRLIDKADLTGLEPFRLLPDSNRKSDTLVIAGVDLPMGKPGFVLLYDTANRQTHDRASGGDLLDHTCAGIEPS